MKMIYLANIRIPTEKAHGLQIMKMCEAFARQGTDVELIVPWRFNPIKENPFEYYGIEKNFKIIKIPSLDLVKFGKIGFIIQSLSFAKCVLLYMLFSAIGGSAFGRKKADAIYSRDELPLFYLTFFKKNIFWESHDGRFNFVIKRVLLKCKAIISITQGLKDFYVTKGINPEKILVAPDGVDLKEFDIDISKEEARRKLNLPQDKKIILYVGSFYFYDWKGADVLLNSANRFSDKHLFLFIGGNDKELKKIKDRYASANILLAGYKHRRDIPYYLKSADVLVVPNTAREKISSSFTSPMKMFEYMAAKRPIVASDIASLKEILNKENAFFVRPDDPQNLAEGIKTVLQNVKLADKISKQAYLDVKEYSWDKRGKKITEYIKSKIIQN